MSLFNFFSKNSRQQFLKFSPQSGDWHVVTWNFDLKDSSERLWNIEVHGKEKKSIQWSRRAVEAISFFEQDKVQLYHKVKKDRQDYVGLMNLAIHATLKHCLESHHEFLTTPVSGAMTSDYQNEARALQWIQASFGTLTRALDQFAQRDDLIFTCAFFSGREPETKAQVLRILAFNLDIFCYFLEDFSLQIAIFDDKNLGHGVAKTPSFQQIIKVTKPQIYDEIVKLMHRIANVGEIR